MKKFLWSLVVLLLILLVVNLVPSPNLSLNTNENAVEVGEVEADNHVPGSAFVRIADSEVSRDLLSDPELLFRPLENYKDRLVNASPSEVPTDRAGRVFVYTGDLRPERMDYSLHRTSGCNFDLADYVNATRRVAIELDIPMRVMGALILSESSFVQLVPDGRGGCYLMNNGVAACLAQVYKPAGWKWGLGSQIHSGITAHQLFDPYTCLRYGGEVLNERASVFEGLTGPRDNPASWYYSVAGYKGLRADPYHSHMGKVYQRYLNAEGFVVPHENGNYWVSFSEESKYEVLSFN